MSQSLPRACALVVCVIAGGLTVRVSADNPNADFGAFVAAELRAFSEQLFGFRRPLEESARGPFDGPSTAALVVAMIYGDELAPGGGRSGGGIYKFVPSIPYAGNGVVTVPAQSPFAAGTIYGLHVGRANNSSNWGQGAETGKGRWTQIDLTIPGVLQQDGDIILDTAQATQFFTGFYRPEDMDIDPVAEAKGVFRACWANTGRWNNAFGSDIENGAVNSEVMCLVEETNPSAPTGTTPVVSRFVPGSPTRQMYDNVAFQPHTGNLVILEDGPTNVVTGAAPGVVSETRGNDIWICLPDGDDDDSQTDGCVRMASLRDTSSEPTGFIFLGSGESAFVSLQHRAVDEANNRGSLLKISGFKVRGDRDHHFNDRFGFDLDELFRFGADDKGGRW